MNSDNVQQLLATNCRPQLIGLVQCENRFGSGSKRCEQYEQEVVACAAYTLCPNPFEETVKCLEDNQGNEKKCERVILSLQRCMEKFDK